MGIRLSRAQEEWGRQQMAEAQANGTYITAETLEAERALMEAQHAETQAGIEAEAKRREEEANKPETRPIVYADLIGQYPHARVVRRKPWQWALPWREWLVPGAIIAAAAGIAANAWPPVLLGLLPLAVPVVNWSLAKARLAWKWLRVVTSERVESRMYNARMETCNDCDRAIVDMDRYPGERFCADCQCGIRWGARLSRKNHYAKWECPLGRHKDTDYRDHPSRTQLIALGYPGDRMVPYATKGAAPKSGGCGSPKCNGGSK